MKKRKKAIKLSVFFCCYYFIVRLLWESIFMTVSTLKKDSFLLGIDGCWSELANISDSVKKAGQASNQSQTFSKLCFNLAKKKETFFFQISNLQIPAFSFFPPLFRSTEEKYHLQPSTLTLLYGQMLNFTRWLQKKSCFSCSKKCLTSTIAKKF